MNFRNVYDERGRVLPWVARELSGKSGCYVIRQRGAGGIPGPVLYVGESHTGRLKKTLLRHFQKWKGPTKGATYDGQAVEVFTVRTRPESAVEMQNSLIEDLSPADNTVGQPGILSWFIPGA